MPGHWTGGMGGAEFQAKLIIDGLLEKGDSNIHYLCRYAKPELVDEPYHIHLIGKRGVISKRSLVFDCFSLYAKLVELQPDIIYQRQGCCYTGVSQFYAKKHGAKLVWHVASDNDVTPHIKGVKKGLIGRLLNFVDKKILEYGIKHVETIIAQTQEQSSLMSQYYSRSPTEVIGNFHPIPTAINCHSYNEKTILWVANFKPIKAPEKILALAKLLPDFQFKMIGRCDQKVYGSLLKKIEESKNIDYLGPKSQTEVNELLASATFFLNTSLAEGFPNTFIQSWGRGVPVLSLNVDPNSVINQELLGGCNTSYEELASFARRVLEGPDSYSLLRERCYNYAMNHHSLTVRDRFIEAFL